MKVDDWFEKDTRLFVKYLEVSQIKNHEGELNNDCGQIIFFFFNLKFSKRENIYIFTPTAKTWRNFYGIEGV